jgi:phage terminase large subunit
MKSKGTTKGKREKLLLARKTIIDPALFAERILGINPTELQLEILESIRHSRKTAIKACHGVGKTFILAVAVLWWLARYEDGVVLTTSSTFRQVRTQLWSEIHRLIGGARVRYPKVNSTEIKLRDEDNFALGLSTNRAENFQGYHGQHVLIIADEAPGIESEVMEAMAGIMAGGNVHLVMAGNPTITSGAFFDAFHRERSSWKCFTIDAFDSPNLQGLNLEQLLLMDPAVGGPLDQNPVPYLVTRRWVYEQYFAWWHGDESGSPIWMSRVRGEFPDQANNALFRLRWLVSAKERALRDPISDSGGRLVAGVDVGGGGAETVVYVCERKPRGYRIVKLGFWRAEDTRGKVVRFLEPYRSRLTTVRVDGTGIGHNFGLHLRDQKFPVELVQVGLPSRSQPKLGENDPMKRFANEKARFYQNVADAFERDEVDGLLDEETIAQLADLQYEIDSRGRIKIESKDDARARRSSSPDRAEALMLAIGDRRKSNRGPYFDEQYSRMYADKGLSTDEIADKLDLSPFEVTAFVQRRPNDGLDHIRSRLETQCPGCHLIISIDSPKSNYLGSAWHAKCVRKAMFGPDAA